MVFEMIAQPVKAVLFLFPITKAYEEFAKSEQEKVEKEG